MFSLLPRVCAFFSVSRPGWLVFAALPAWRPSRPSAFVLSGGPFWFSELMPLDFWPGMLSSARWPWPAAGDFSDFMPDEGEAALLFSCSVVAPPADDGALCICAPPDGRPPVPCALARPVPAISASAATEIKKRFVIPLSPHIVRIARGDNSRRVETFLFLAGPF